MLEPLASILDCSTTLNISLAITLEPRYLLHETKSNFICPIVKYESSPFRSFIIKKSYIHHTWPSFKMKRSQDLKDLYYDTGSFYIYRTNSILKIKNQNFIPKKSTYIILKKKLIDVNYPEDLKALKKIFKINKYNK